MSSNWLPVKSGVPQDSVLGPLLFSLYIDLMDIDFSPGTEILLFADDILLYKPIWVPTDVNHLQRDVNKLSNWTKQNYLQINNQKTKTLVISRKRPQNTILCRLFLDDVPINLVKNYKYLGVVIVDDLTWSAHIETITCKVRRLMGFIYHNSCPIVNSLLPSNSTNHKSSQYWIRHVLSGTHITKRTRKP